MMRITETNLSGLKVIEPTVFSDSRGFFFEGFQSERYAKELNLKKPLLQLNFSRSQVGVLRGLHYQLTKPQAKLVTVLRGRVLDVAVDIRRASQTFGQWYACELSDENHKQIYIPEGFAHGFLVLSDEVDFCYACTDYYDPSAERGIIWNDTDLKIPWNIQSPILSDKDKLYQSLKDIPSKDLFVE